jgi:mxaA protein
MMRGWCFIAFLLLGFQSANAAIDAVNIYEPRNFGYFIGDTIERNVEVVTSGNTELFTAALPRPGPLTYWLDLIEISHSVRQNAGQKIYNIKLRYQIFYSAVEATELDIPAFPLKFKNPTSVAPDASGPSDANDAASKYSASVPAFRMIVAPLRDLVLVDLMPEKSKELTEILRPDVQAREIPIASKARLLTVSGIALLLSAILLSWHYAIGPFKKRTGRPFTQADRQIRNLLSYGANDASYRDALLILHRAFDETAGHRLFTEDAGVFAKEHPRFRALAPRFKSFFESSRLFFFSDDRPAAEHNFPMEEVRQLASDLARDERSAA